MSNDTTPSAFSEHVGGDWYKNLAIQPVRFWLENQLPGTEAAVVKYITRYASKDGKKDLEKAHHLISMMREVYYPASTFNLQGGYRPKPGGGFTRVPDKRGDFTDPTKLRGEFICIPDKPNATPMPVPVKPHKKKWRIEPEEYVEKNGLGDKEALIVILVCRATTDRSLVYAQTLITQLINQQYSMTQDEAVEVYEEHF